MKCLVLLLFFYVLFFLGGKKVLLLNRVNLVGYEFYQILCRVVRQD